LLDHGRDTGGMNDPARPSVFGASSERETDQASLIFFILFECEKLYPAIAHYTFQKLFNGWLY